MFMKYRITAMASLLAASCSLQAEAPIIRSVDMFYKVGEYYRAYANDFDPQDAGSRYSVPPGLIQPAGENLLWDFSVGPTEVVHRFDYVDPTGLWEALEFPQANVAEHKTVEGTGIEAWLFFEQVTGEGRRVYGFYDEVFAPYTPVGVFVPEPIIDFPENIRYDQPPWFTDMTVYSTIAYSDPEASAIFPVKLDFHSKFTADAWGTALLPGVGLVPVLRINEEQSVDISIDVAIDPAEEGSYTYFETDYLRNYYWLSPGRGIVAQLNSTQGSFLPDAEFSSASVFLRMFETNKEAEPIDTGVKSVENLEVIVSNGLVLIRWSEASNATGYQVEYSIGGLGSDDWQPLGGQTTAKQVLDPNGLGTGARFYRVVSLP
jgi:hypothetical protein